MKKTPLAVLLSLGLLHAPLSAFAATQSPLDLVGPVSDYKIYVIEKVDQLAVETAKFTDAIKKGIANDGWVYYETIGGGQGGRPSGAGRSASHTAMTDTDQLPGRPPCIEA